MNTTTTNVTFARFCRIFAGVIEHFVEEGYDYSDLAQGGIHMCLVFDENFQAGYADQMIEVTVRERLCQLVGEAAFHEHGRKLVGMIQEVERFGHEFSHKMVQKYFGEDLTDCKLGFFDQARILWLREIAAKEEAHSDPKVRQGRELVDTIIREADWLKDCVARGHELGDLTGCTYSILNLAEALHNLTEELEMKKVAAAVKVSKVEPSPLQEMGTGFRWAKLPE